MSARLLLAAAPLALLAACSPAAEEAGPVDEAAVLAAIAEVEQGQAAAFNADDAAGATAVYAEGAHFFDAGSAPLDDPAAISAAFAAMLADPGSALAITRVDSWVADSGELAVTLSDYTQTYTGEDGAPVTVEGVNQTVWAKQADGSWKIVADFNGATGEPAPAAAAAPAGEAPAEPAAAPTPE